MSTWFFVVLAGLFLLGVYNALKQQSQLRYIKQYRFHPMIKQKTACIASAIKRIRAGCSDKRATRLFLYLQ
ncbi:hypothetical protein [Methylocucumis oryzae]|uniref:hypothetical protein n=1 Tax=Methylocucumis oryzae TaxID=1632867 RepID=UPI000D6DF67C|nr:hypothetical protein [Methylocucumis oryzae]